MPVKIIAQKTGFLLHSISALKIKTPPGRLPGSVCGFLSD
jgi:hypothetical protein